MIIPLDKVAEGADLCLENAVQFCSDARVLCDKSSYDHALASCIFAIEELGKAVLLKSKAAYALKEAKDVVVLKYEKPENIFQMHSEDLKAKGFPRNKEKGLKEVNPFCHHLSKLLCASNTLYMATYTNVVKSLDGKGFQSIDEINETIEEMLKEAHEITVYSTDLRELALYVDYDQGRGIWSKGRLKVTQTKLRRLVADIETAVELNRQWKLPLRHQTKP